MVSVEYSIPVSTIVFMVLDKEPWYNSYNNIWSYVQSYVDLQDISGVVDSIFVN